MDNSDLNASAAHICLGEIVGVQGLNGQVRIKTYTQEPESLTAYGELTNADHEPFRIKITQIKSQNLVIASVHGCSDRTQAEKLVKTRLYIHRSQLSLAAEDEYYHYDLIGMTVMDQDNIIIGKVKSVENYGAGDFLEIVGEQKRVYTLPFNKTSAPTVDLTNKKLYIEKDFLLF